MSALPEGWESDYDGARWFFRYKATGTVQYHFPKAGDEYPQFYDNFGPIQQTYRPTPEERLEIDRQSQVRRKSSQNSSRAREAAARVNAAGPLSTMGASEPLNSFDTFGYFGPGSANDVFPIGDGNGRSRPGSNLATPTTANSYTTTTAGSPVPPIRELSSTTVVMHELADITAMGGRHYASDPVGNVKELPTGQTDLCVAEANLPPVELASNEPPFGGSPTVPAGMVEVSAEPIQPAQPTQDIQGTEEEAQPVQAVHEAITSNSQPPVPVTAQQEQENTSRGPQAQRRPPAPTAPTGVGQTPAPAAGDSVLTYRPFRATSVSADPDTAKRSSVVTGNMTIAESQDLEMVVGVPQSTGQYHASLENRGLNNVPLFLQPAHDPQTKPGNLDHTPGHTECTQPPCFAEKQASETVEHNLDQPTQPNTDIPALLLPAHARMAFKSTPEPAPNAILSHVPSVLRPAGSRKPVPTQQTSASCVPPNVPAPLTVEAPRPPHMSPPHEQPTASTPPAVISNSCGGQQEPPVSPGIHRTDTVPLKLPSETAAALGGSGPQAGEFRQHAFSVDFGIFSTTHGAGASSGRSTTGPELAARPMAPGLALAPAPLRVLRQTPPASRTSTPTAPPAAIETVQVVPVTSASFEAMASDATPAPTKPRSPSPTPMMSASFASTLSASNITSPARPAAVHRTSTQPGSRTPTPTLQSRPAPAMSALAALGNPPSGASPTLPPAQFSTSLPVQAQQQPISASGAPMTDTFASIAPVPAPMTSMPSPQSFFAAPAPLAAGSPPLGATAHRAPAQLEDPSRPVMQPQIPQPQITGQPIQPQQTPPLQAYPADMAQVQRKPTRRKPVGGHGPGTQPQPGTRAPGTAAAHRMSVSSVVSQNVAIHNWPTPAPAESQSPGPGSYPDSGPPQPGNLMQSNQLPIPQPGFQPSTPAHSIGSQSPQLPHQSPALSITSIHRNSVSGQPKPSASVDSYGAPDNAHRMSTSTPLGQPHPEPAPHPGMQQIQSGLPGLPGLIPQQHRRENTTGKPPTVVQGVVGDSPLPGQQPSPVQQYGQPQPGLQPDQYQGQYQPGQYQPAQDEPAPLQPGQLQLGKSTRPELPPRNSPTPFQQALPDAQSPLLPHGQTMPLVPQSFPGQQPPGPGSVHPQHSQTIPAATYQPSLPAGPAMGPQTMPSLGGCGRPSFGPRPTPQQGMSFQAPPPVENKASKSNRLSKLMKNSAVTKTAFSLGGAFVAQSLGMTGDLGAQLGEAAHDKYKRQQAQNQQRHNQQAIQTPASPYGRETSPVYTNPAGQIPGIPAPSPILGVAPGVAPGYPGSPHDRAAAGRGQPIGRGYFVAGRGHPAAGRGSPAGRGSSAAVAAIAGMGRGAPGLGAPVAAAGAGTALTGALIHQLLKPGQTPAEQQETVAQLMQAQQEQSQLRYLEVMQQIQSPVVGGNATAVNPLATFDVANNSSPTYAFGIDTSTTYGINNADPSGGFDFSNLVGSGDAGSGLDTGTLLQDSIGNYTGDDWGGDVSGAW